MWLKFSPSLILNKIEHFETASIVKKLQNQPEKIILNSGLMIL